MVWCTGVPNSVGIPEFLYPSTRWKTSIVSTTRRNGAHRRVRCNAFIKSAFWITGETLKRRPNKWLRNKRGEKASVRWFERTKALGLLMNQYNPLTGGLTPVVNV